MSENGGFEQRLSLVTLGVANLEESMRFYQDVLGWTRSSVGGAEVTFFQLNGIVLGLLPRDALAADVGADSLESGEHSRVALAYNVRERDGVDRLLSRVEQSGARVVKAGGRMRSGVGGPDTSRTRTGSCGR